MSEFRITGETPLRRALLRLSLPNLAEESLMLLIGWTDWYLAGHFVGGDAAWAAMGLIGYLMWLLPNLFASVSIGALAMVSRFIGSGEREKAASFAKQSLLLGFLWAAGIATSLFLFGESLVEMMQLEGEAAALAVQYLMVLVPAIPLLMIEKVGGACLHGSGDTITGFWARVIVVAANLIASYSLVTGSFGCPRLGWAGLAWGTAIGHFLAASLIVWALAFRKDGLWRGVDWRPDPLNWRRILNVGLPGGFDVATMIGAQFVFLGMINSLGTAQAAAHSLAIQIEACAYLPASAFAVAASAMTGQLLGAGLPDRAAKAARTCLIAGVLVVSAAGVLIYFEGETLATFFSGNESSATTSLTGDLLKIVAFATPSLATIIVMAGVMRGSGDTRVPFLFTVAGLIMIRIPLTAWMCFDNPFLFASEAFAWANGWGLGLGVVGGWYAMAIDLVVRSLLFSARFVSGKWKRVRL